MLFLTKYRFHSFILQKKWNSQCKGTIKYEKVGRLHLDLSKNYYYYYFQNNVSTVFHSLCKQIHYISDDSYFTIEHIYSTHAHFQSELF